MAIIPIALTARPAWQALAGHSARVHDIHLRTLFAENPRRGDRQSVPTLDRSRYASADGVRRGACVLCDAANGNPALILIASGSEVGARLAVETGVAQALLDSARAGAEGTTPVTIRKSLAAAASCAEQANRTPS